MRLIDADILQEKFEEVKQKVDSLSEISQIIGVQSVIDGQPTAYDVDKVVEQLENLGLVFADYYPDGTNISRESRKSIPYDRAIEIVKSGVVE